MDLSAYEQWMVRSNLDRIAAGANAEATIAMLRANGYDRVADAVTEALDSAKAELWRKLALHMLWNRALHEWEMWS